jgi:hypothetical protein
MSELNEYSFRGEEYPEGRPAYRTWPVTLLALLLVMQALAMFIIAAYYISLVEFDFTPTPQDLTVDLPLTLNASAFIGLGVLGLLAGIGFFRLWRTAWFLAISLQGLSLLFAIIKYFQYKPVYGYIIMVFCIFMVIYLNYSDVLATFRTEPSVKEWGGIDEE